MPSIVSFFVGASYAFNYFYIGIGVNGVFYHAGSVVCADQVRAPDLAFCPRKATQPDRYPLGLA